MRLRDDQVGNLIHWSQTKQVSLAKPKFCIFWPFDFSAIRKPLVNRIYWGSAYTGDSAELRSLLSGGKTAPSWKELPLPPTYTSSGRIMAEELHKNSSTIEEAEGSKGGEEQ